MLPEYFIIIIIIIFIMRLHIIKKALISQVDQYSWMKLINAMRVNPNSVPEIKEYILDLKQWYPPLFARVLSKFSEDFLNKYSILITQFLSLIRLSILIYFYFQINGSYDGLLFAIIIYLTAPILVYYDNQINGRLFGAILVDLALLSYYFYFESDLGIFFLLFTVLITVLLFFSHKMSQQLLIWLNIFIAIYFKSLIPILVIIVSVIIAFIFGYKKYFKAHLEIVAFWHRNRYKLGSHQFYESKLYGKDGFVYKFRLHGDGVKSFIKKILLIIGMLPFVLFIIFNFEFSYFGLVIIATLILILLTSFFDSMLCLGSGNLYSYNMVTFLGFYLITTNIDFISSINQFLIVVVFIMTFGSIFKFYRGLNNKQKQKDNNYNEAVDFLEESELDRIMVIPFQLPDEIAFKTGKKVFWGAHGYGFKWIEPYFPVFNEKIENAIFDWNLGGIFLQKEYWPEFFDKVNMNLFYTEFENEKYIILSVKNWKEKNIIPSWAIEKYPDIFKV